VEGSFLRAILPCECFPGACPEEAFLLVILKVLFSDAPPAGIRLQYQSTPEFTGRQLPRDKFFRKITTSTLEIEAIMKSPSYKADGKYGSVTIISEV